MDCKTNQVGTLVWWRSSRHPREGGKKNYKKIEKKKENLFSMVFDKICIFCLYPILDSLQYVKRGNCRCPFCPGYCVYFEPRAHLWGVSNLGLEPCPFLLYRVFKSFWISYFISCLFHIYSSFIVKCHFVSLRIMSYFSY